MIQKIKRKVIEIEDKGVLVLKIALITAFLIFGSVFLIDYLDFTATININNIPINYTFKEKFIETAGRADDRYKMIFLYNNELHEIYVSRNEYNLIENGIYPQIFKSNESGKFYSYYNKEKALRIVIICSLFITVIVIFPSNLDKKLIKLMKLYKEKEKLIKSKISSKFKR